MTSRTTRTTPRNTRITSRTIRTTPISSPPSGGLLICMVLMVLEVILVVLGVVLVVLEVVLVVLEVVLVVLEVTGPQVSLVKFQTRLSLRPDLYSTAPPIDCTMSFMRF